MKISIDIAGCVNNVHVNVKGRGSLDPEASALYLELESDRNTVHWDLALLPVCSFDPLLAMAGGAVGVPEEGIPPVAFRSWADIFDDNDREMGRIVVSGQVNQALGELEVGGQILECRTRFEIGELISTVAAPTRLAVLRSPADRFELSRTASFATLRVLKTLPVDTLKIDRSFVANVDRQPIDAAIIAAIVMAAASVGCRIVAEGVERIEQAAVLYRLGCTRMQGYLFAQPMPADKLGALLREKDFPWADLVDRFQRESDESPGSTTWPSSRSFPTRRA